MLKCEFQENHEILMSVKNMYDEFIKESDNYIKNYNDNEKDCCKIKRYIEDISKLILQTEKYIIIEDYISACDVLKYKIQPELTKLSNATR
ncbi:hypothetical protein EQM05_09735 [Clostridium sp. JN-9]|nr:hypothetical protein EQM05_09735 [Clostridium sp. JN-9]